MAIWLKTARSAEERALDDAQVRETVERALDDIARLLVHPKLRAVAEEGAPS